MAKDNINVNLLIENCKQGNRNSQRGLYEYFYGYGMSIALRYSKTKDQAQEILNDAFLKVFMNLDRFDADRSFKPWLRKIIIYGAIDQYRANQKYMNHISFSTEMEIADDPFPLPEISPNEDVLPIIQKLPPAYQMVFNLYVMEEYKHQEIAEKLNIKVSTSKSNLARAKANLRKMLSKKRLVKAKSI